MEITLGGFGEQKESRTFRNLKVANSVTMISRELQMASKIV
jgi:hypothetical protein